jgi:hypothetical protein
MKIDLTPTYNKISRKLESILRSQAPVDTGNLKNSIAVVYDAYGFIIYDPTDYGMYLHRGTGEEKDAATSTDDATTYYNLLRKKWNPKPGKGEGGIRPRYWMNFSDSVYEMIDQELEKAITEELEKGITEQLNRA